MFDSFLCKLVMFLFIVSNLIFIGKSSLGREGVNEPCIISGLIATFFCSLSLLQGCFKRDKEIL